MKRTRLLLATLLLVIVAAPGCAGTVPGNSADNPDAGISGDGKPNPSDMFIPSLDKGGAPVKCQITHPARAAMLSASPSITIKGKVSSPLSGLSSVKVNGKKVNPLPNGEFSLAVTSKWGVNIITLDCLGKDSNTDHRVQAYHWSAKYWPNTGGVAAMKVPLGALARLYQKALDDGDHTSMNDLASILEKVINTLNFDTLIPTTLVSGSYKIPPWGPTINYSVTKTGAFKVNPFTISLKSRTGGMRVTGKTSYLELPVKAKAGVTVSGKVKIYNLSMDGDIDISKKSGGAVQASVSRLDMTYSSLKVDIGSGITGSIMSSITNGLASLFKNTILTKMEDEVKKVIAGPVKSFVTGFQFAQTFTLPAVLGSKKLSIYTDLDTVQFDGNGGDLGLNTVVHGTKGIADGKLGTLSTSASFSPPATSSASMLMALRYDTLNQVLNATWYTGAMRQDLSSLINDALKNGKLPLPFTVNSVKLNMVALLPPVLVQGKGQSDFELQVGDLKLVVEANLKDLMGKPATITAQVYVSAKAPGSIKLSANNVLSLSLSTTLSAYEVEVDNMVVKGDSTNLGQLFVVLVKEMVKVLLPQLGPNIMQSFPLPAIDLSSLGGSYGIPKGTILKIKSGKLYQQGGYLVFSGDLG